MVLPTLFPGSTGPYVTLIQQALNMGDSSFDPLDEDGIFGRFTGNRVKEFQGQSGLTPDGVAGPMTHAQLEELYQALAQMVGPAPGGSDGARLSIVGVARNAEAVLGWDDTHTAPPPDQSTGRIAARYGDGANI